MPLIEPARASREVPPHEYLADSKLLIGKDVLSTA